MSNKFIKDVMSFNLEKTKLKKPKKNTKIVLGCVLITCSNKTIEFKCSSVNTDLLDDNLILGLA